mmetsp:Transcript_8882/g.22395  ORF Transcript_8882/g.22395 Transcript_8882/m.22395 type:complete len:243 (+) Transcript_8882:1013-1741(+)
MKLSSSAAFFPFANFFDDRGGLTASLVLFGFITRLFLLDLPVSFFGLDLLSWSFFFFFFFLSLFLLLPGLFKTCLLLDLDPPLSFFFGLLGPFLSLLEGFFSFSSSFSSSANASKGSSNVLSVFPLSIPFPFFTFSWRFTGVIDFIRVKGSASKSPSSSLLSANTGQLLSLLSSIHDFFLVSFGGDFEVGAGAGAGAGAGKLLTAGIVGFFFVFSLSLSLSLSESESDSSNHDFFLGGSDAL